MKTHLITPLLILTLSIFGFGSASIAGEPIAELLRPLERPNLDSAKIVVGRLDDYQKTAEGKEKDDAEIISNTIRILFTEDYRVGKALEGIAVAEKKATEEENRAADWLVPNAFGRVNMAASNAAQRKAKELREKAALEVREARNELRDAIRKADALMTKMYEDNLVDCVIIFYAMIEAVNSRSLSDNPFQTKTTEAAVNELRDFGRDAPIWLADVRAAELAANHEKAVRLFTKARDVEGRKRNAAKLAEKLEDEDLIGSAIEYYEIAGDFARAKALREAHPNLLSGSFATLEPEDIYVKTSVSCVQIVTETKRGSGFFFKRGGYILTNNHVIDGDGVTITVKTEDGKVYSSEIVATSETPDLAVIKIDLKEHEIIRLGNSETVETVKIGSPVVLIGYPIDDFSTATMNSGSVSNTDLIFLGNPCYQLDASANHGNSGGPVLDAQGRVVGILTSGLGDFGIDRFNFAIQIDAIWQFLSDKLGPDFANN